MRVILLFVLVIIPLNQSFADICIQEFMPKPEQVLNDRKLGEYAGSLSKKSEFGGKIGIITYGAATITVKKASMRRRYQQTAQMQARKNFLLFIKKSSSTMSGMVTLERCTKDILGKAFLIVKAFTPH